MTDRSGVTNLATSRHQEHRTVMQSGINVVADSVSKSLKSIGVEADLVG
ncbi:hypothetical protein ACFOJ6_25130 [Gordonia humi]